MKHKAFLDFELKSADDEQRVIKGVATTPKVDRVGDIVEPLGTKFAKTIPLFLYHDHTKSVGEVELGKPTANGVPFTARIPKVLEAGNLRDRVDEAWQMVKYGLIKAVSIGFQNLGGSQPLKAGGVKFLNTEIFELSLVPIPANPDAAIQFYRSAFQEQQSAASGAVSAVTVPPHLQAQHVLLSSGVSGNSTSKGTRMKTSVAEQIGNYEAERAYKMQQVQSLLDASSEESRPLNETEQKQYDDLTSEVESTDKHVDNLRRAEKLLLTATPVTSQAGNDPDSASRVRQDAGRPSSVIFSKRNDFPGQGFARLCKAIAIGQGSRSDTELYIRENFKDMPEIGMAYKELSMVQKAAVAAGTTTDANWAAPLVNYQDLAGQFIDLLRPATILGRLTQVRRVPFNVRIAKLATGATAQWVGQGLAKPLSALDFDSLTMQFTKLATIVVLTDELVRFSSPSAEQTVRDEIVAAVAQAMDATFIDPSVAAVSNVSPASITNGITAITSAGNSVANVTTALTSALSGVAVANVNLASGVWIMRPQTAVYLSTLRTTQEILAFPGMGLTGGTLLGFPVIVSGNMPADTGSSSYIVFLVQNEIYVADDGQSTVTASREASLQMDSAPAAGAQALVSMFQNNMVAIRAERFANWMRRRDTAVAVIQDVSY